MSIGKKMVEELVFIIIPIVVLSEILLAGIKTSYIPYEFGPITVFNMITRVFSLIIWNKTGVVNPIIP